MFGKDAQGQTTVQDGVQPSFGQSITMPEPSNDNSAAPTADASTSPAVTPESPPAPDNVGVPTEESSVNPGEDTTSNSPAPTSDATGNEDLLKIKQDALQNLAPLVGQLDQSPEEKFKTTMMMIQAADDQSLIKDAYETAGLITDEKARAQALLDIVNEINYFTQKHND